MAVDPSLHDQVQLRLESGDWEDAMALLREHLCSDADDADARHWLGAILLDAGEVSAAAAEWRRVRQIDMRSDWAHGRTSRRTEARVEAAALEALAELPHPFIDWIKDVPLVLEERPSAALVAEAFDPRAYGLFEGPNHADRRMLDVPAAPTRIVIFYANLAADFEDGEALKTQVAITVAHEVGHYFGLDEDDMERLGLD